MGELTTVELLAALQMERHNLRYLLKKFPGSVAPVRMIGPTMMWDTSVIPTIKDLKARLLPCGPRKDRLAKRGTV